VNALVVGGGAVGSFLAWALATGGAPTTLVSRRHPGPASESRIDVVARDGSRRSADVRVTDAVDQVPHPDVIVLAVKAYDVEAAVRSIGRWPSATVVTVQNGIGSEEAVLGARPASALIAASLTASVELGPDGAVRWLRRGGIGLARVTGAPGVSADTLAGVFGRSGLRTRTHPDWRAMKWSKLLANLVGNASSALLDLPPAAVYAEAGLFELERRQLNEALGVIQALGLKPVNLPGANVRGLVLALRLPAIVGRPILRRVVAAGRGGKDPSLRLGLAAEAARTEMHWLNGAVAREAAGLGLEAPVNAALADLLERASRDGDLRTQLKANPTRLMDAVSAHAAGGDTSGTTRPVTR
jgi:2-dehydropantoate 2-reductase